MNSDSIDSNEEIISWFEEVVMEAENVQAQTLRRILELNWGVEYLKKWLGEDPRILDMDPRALQSLYSSMVPIASHQDLEPYIQKIADGETSPILTREPITTLSLSSGTTNGRPKFVPFTRHSALTTLQSSRISAAFRSREFPTRAGGRILEFIYSSKQFQTKGGLTAGTATTHYYASQEFGMKQRATKTYACSPPEVISGGDYKESTYCHLLLGLVFSEQVELVASTFAYSIVQAFGALEDLWEEICLDLRHGTLSGRISSPKMREAMAKLLLPSPPLALRIEEKCRELKAADWWGAIPKLWPNSKYVHSIMTGSMQPYLRKLRHYAGELPLISADYGSTESWIGVNIDPASPPEEAVFAVVPTFSYFEFIPLHRRRQQQQSCEEGGKDFTEGEAVPLSEVRMGREYEVVLTTFTGLYRCRLGDVVQVSGFHGRTPKLSFICRRNLILTINIDKNTEKDLQLAVERGSRLLARNNAELVDFTSHASVSHNPGHYIVYWEIKGEADDDILAICCRELDESFIDHGYVVSRRSKSIGPLELRIVEDGTFGKILDFFIANGAAIGQFKTPRCTNNRHLLAILEHCTVKRFISSAYN